MIGRSMFISLDAMSQLKMIVSMAHFNKVMDMKEYIFSSLIQTFAPHHIKDLVETMA
jgi:hypothetical protein